MQPTPCNFYNVSFLETCLDHALLKFSLRMYDLPCGDLFRIWEKVLGFALGSFVTFMHEDTDMPVGSS